MESKGTAGRRCERHNLCIACSGERAERDALLRRAREALTFYSDPATYQSPSKGFALQYDPAPAPIADDHAGDRARVVISAIAALLGEGKEG